MTELLGRPRGGRRAGVAGTGPSAGIVGRRRPLPSGRAVTGGFLVAAAAVLALTTSIGAGRTEHQQWVVARRPLAAGTRITAGDLGTEAMSLPAGSTGARSFHFPAGLAGRVLAAPLLAGELVQQGALVPTGAQPALRPVTVPVDAPDVVDLSTGIPVDVLVTDGSDPGASTTVVVRGATVLDVATAGSSLLSSSGGDTVTLGVATLAEVEAVVHAAHTGSLAVVVAQRSDGTGLGQVPSAAGATGTGGGAAGTGGGAAGTGGGAAGAGGATGSGG